MKNYEDSKARFSSNPDDRDDVLYNKDKANALLRKINFHNKNINPNKEFEQLVKERNSFFLHNNQNCRRMIHLSPSTIMNINKQSRPFKAPA